MMNEPIEFKGGFSLERVSEQDYEAEGQTAGKENSVGHFKCWHLSKGRSIKLRIADISWEDGTRDIRCVSRLDSRESFDGIVERLRYGISPHKNNNDLEFVRLRIIESTDTKSRKPRGSLKQTTINHIHTKTLIHIDQQLRSLGAEDIDTLGGVVNHRQRADNDLYVTFPKDNSVVPVAAWCISVAIVFTRDIGL